MISILLTITINAFEYEPQIREPFEDYKIEQPYKAPAKALIDWNNLDYDDAMWGWYYKQLWYLYHANSGETPPWLKPMPIDDDLIPYLIMCGIFAVCTHFSTNRTNSPLSKRTQSPFNKINR